MEQEQNIKNEDNSFDITSLNEVLGEGYKFEDIGSLKEVLSFRDKYSELEKNHNNILSEKENLSKKYDELNGKYGNVVDYFSGEDVVNKLYGSPERYTRIELEKKFPDKDPTVVSKIYSSDLNSLSSTEKILLADKLNVRSDISDKDRLDAIYQSLGIEDPSDLDGVGRYKLEKAASQAIEQLKSIKEFKPDELKFDFKTESDTRKKELTEKTEKLNELWGKGLSEAISKYDGTHFFDVDKDGNKTELFHYQVNDKFKEAVLPEIVKNLVNAGIEPSDENIQFAVNEIDKLHFIQNKDKILKAAMEKSRTKTEDSVYNEVHNTKETNTKEAPPRNNDKKGITLMEMLQAKKNKTIK
jgi:hypothetical protein